MRIRKYMVLGVLSIVVLPWVVYLLISLMGAHPWTAGGSGREKLTEATQMIIQNERNWGNAAWQRRLMSESQRDGIDVEITSPSNQVIFASSQGPFHQHWMSSQQTAVVDNGKWVGTVRVSRLGQGDPIAAIGAILACILAIVFVSFQVGRNVIKPLESMSRAALQIADGDLDLELASSSTVEIRKVRTAFEVMVKGLREAFAKQQKLEDERRFFIGAIAHDLRTPLFALRGYLDGMEQGIASTPEKMAHYVSICKEKAVHWNG